MTSNRLPDSELPRDSESFLPTLELRRCIDETQLEQISSEIREKPITEANLRRLFKRRWWSAVKEGAPERSEELYAAGCRVWDNRMTPP